ncbi:MAG TPA: type II secretion system F family protein [Candidatus Saccharimonadales bacterium]|jgi:tight adherence protein B|nr:type II secretion system F family protein [Candidatus Saccharimonadales bacterium]
MTPTPMLVAALGASAMLVVVVGLWFPAFIRSRALRRRLSGALADGTSAIAADVGGSRRRRDALRRIRRDGGNRWLTALEDRIDNAALDLTAGEVVAAMGLLAIVGAFVGVVLGGFVGALLGVLVGGWIPLFWLQRRRARRQRQFADQLPDTVSLLASTVRAGHSLLQGLEQVARESAEPTRSAFETVVREIGLGASQNEAIDRLGQRFPSDDVSLIVASVNVHQQIGGSLAHVLDDISATLRERVRIEGDIRALTAQQRYSAYVLALLPVAVAAALFLISRDYITLLFEGSLRIAAVAAGVLIVIGFFTMRRMATIDV